MSIPRHHKLQKTDTIFNNVRRRRSLDRALRQLRERRRSYGR